MSLYNMILVHHAWGVMLKWFWKGSLALLLATWCVGCTSTSITNLTPSELPRTSSGLYRVEAAWASNQRTVDKGTLEPVVIIGETQYPMQPVPYAQDRFETMIPVAADTDAIIYHFKFNYLYNTLPAKKNDSKRTEDFRLEILPDGEL